ncbi:Uncharacterised protein [Shigella sonnei]|nr:Uncharacterised protein [Shigella sonnei]
MVTGCTNAAEWRGTGSTSKRFVPVNNPHPRLQQQLIEFFPLGGNQTARESEASVIRH